MAKKLPSTGAKLSAVERLAQADIHEMKQKLPPAFVAKETKAAPTPAPAAREPEKNLFVTVPVSVHREIKQRTLDEGLTVRTFVLRALAAQGVEVDPAELMDLRGRR